MAEAEPPGVRAEALAGLADQYIGAARLASALVHPGAPDTGPAPAGNLLVEEVVQGDPWGWFMAERSNLLRLVEQAHAARLLSRWDEASGAFRACICHGDVPDGDHGIVSGYRAGAGGRIETGAAVA